MNKKAPGKLLKTAKLTGQILDTPTHLFTKIQRMSPRMPLTFLQMPCSKLARIADSLNNLAFC